MTTGENNEGGTLLLAALAATVFAAVRIETAWSVGWTFAQVAVYVGGAAVLWAGLQWTDAFRWNSPRWMPVAVTVWVLAPCVWEAVARRLGVGDASEILLLACLQNAALVLAAFSHRRRCQQTAVLLASFLVLFALVMGTTRAVFLLAGLYGVLVLWWLMARYWDRVAGARAAINVQRCLPVRSSVLVGTIIAVLAAGAALGGVGGTTYVLRGFLPTSGGDRWNDPYARAGVGDGDAMVAAREEAMSFGPVESELFLESDMPTLYDMFNEQYGDPPKPKGQRERAIALDSGTVKETHQQTAQTQRSGREFSTLRKQIELHRKPLADRDAPAMLYVVGRVPLHLRLETFDAFDGAVWTRTQGATDLPPPVVEKQGDRTWVAVRPNCAWPILRGTDFHAVKFINLKTVRVPSPPLLDALHIDRLDQADFFAWTNDGQIEMPGRDHIPQLTVVHLRSSGMNLEPLRAQDFVGSPVGSRGLGRSGPPEGGTASVAAATTAAAWTRDVPRGWRQVETIVARLRRGFELDGNVRAPQDCLDTIAWFLDARRGPDYLFATTAAVMLRSLGYSTRLASGFYARPERFDHRAGQTAVLAEDVHVWTEVCIDGRTWIPIEATPGYAAPRERLTWRQWAAGVARDAAGWAGRHAVLLAVCLSVALAGWFQRVAVLDALGYAAWRLAASGRAEQRVRWTIRLLEWRGWYAGRPRPREATLSSWYGEVAGRLPADTAAALQQFLRSTERILYAPPTTFPSGAGEIVSACHRVAREVTGRRLRG